MKDLKLSKAPTKPYTEPPKAAKNLQPMQQREDPELMCTVCGNEHRRTGGVCHGYS